MIVQIQRLYFEDLKETKNFASLQWAFDAAKSRDFMHFFIATRVTGSSPYEAAGQGFHFLDLKLSQKPIDDFIKIIEALLDANAQNRAEERVTINPATADAMGLKAKDVMVEVDDEVRKAILRDLSFSGAKVLIASIGPELNDKLIMLRLDLSGVGLISLPGKVVRFEDIAGHSDIAVFAIDLDRDSVPPDYNLRFKQLLCQQR